ncbi:MAG TPA: phosphate ABC transporter permease PstA [Candidatus Limnocylindrales bacterium]|jgi:phosphate transport system permease protein|nr:phosphate ABC transporter permease PstA [Candidatus Limnocylindrales bacterium]
MAAATPAARPATRFEPALMRRKLSGTVFYGACLAAIGLLLLTLVALLVDVFVRAAPWLDVDFLTGVPSSRPARAGILPAMVGTFEIGLIVGAVTFPIGVAAAIYLAEYAADSRLNRLLQTNISNLAGVPSIIYGILGLAVFVRALALGPTILSAALTLSLLILPVVIIASIEALKAVPQAQREGAYALGASRWQMVRRSVLPAAAPGIMTGIILAMARAIGEAAPLILIGAFTFVTFLPNPIEGQYTVLPIQIYGWATRPQADFQGISAAAIVVVLGLMLVLNGLALVVRARLSRHIQW